MSVGIGLALTVALAGCFGGDERAQNYTLAVTKDCFEQNGDTVRRDDPAAGATGGSLRVDYSDYSAHIDFAASDSDAKRLKRRVIDDAFFPFEKVDVVQRRNVVYSSNRRTMPEDMREKIEACLK